MLNFIFLIGVSDAALEDPQDILPGRVAVVKDKNILVFLDQLPLAGNLKSDLSHLTYILPKLSFLISCTDLNIFTSYYCDYCAKTF